MKTITWLGCFDRNRFEEIRIGNSYKLTHRSPLSVYLLFGYCCYADGAIACSEKCNNLAQGRSLAFVTNSRTSALCSLYAYYASREAIVWVDSALCNAVYHSFIEAYRARYTYHSMTYYMCKVNFIH